MPRGRFAPSPTGTLHLGNARTALLAWLDARAAGARFALRMEDLDHARCPAGAAERLLADLRWLGLDWDEGPGAGGPHLPYEQSLRGARYDAAVEALAARGLAYPCWCSRAEIAAAASAPHADEDGPRYPGTCARGRTEAPSRAPAWRLRVPEGATVFDDRVLGRLAVDVQATVGDFVLRRADGVASYQLACALDDADMEVTDVVRGDDLAPSTPRQLAILDALGRRAPRYAHVGLVVGVGGERLAKRDRAAGLTELRARGADPRAVVGLLAALSGLAPAGERLRPSDLVPGFSLERVGRGPAVLDPAAVERLTQA